ncbi:MAG: BON domain-containing protein [Cyanobacteria bacterium]|nr:BON domain-containing protein [Cyanobacteriota bacterium]
MADYRRQYEDSPRRPDREWPDRASEETRPWFRDGGDRLRWEHNPENWGEQHVPATDATPSWGPRERGGYWRRYESARPHFVGRGPKGYQRSDDRIREEICDCMTEDPMLDASEIEVDVRQGEVMLCGSVTSRDQKRRAEDVAERISGVRDVTNQLRVTRDGAGHNRAADSRAAGPGMTSTQPVTEASGKGTPSKSTSGTSA